MEEKLIKLRAHSDAIVRLQTAIREGREGNPAYGAVLLQQRKQERDELRATLPPFKVIPGGRTD